MHDTKRIWLHRLTESALSLANCTERFLQSSVGLGPASHHCGSRKLKSGSSCLSLLRQETRDERLDHVLTSGDSMVAKLVLRSKHHLQFLLRILVSCALVLPCSCMQSPRNAASFFQSTHSGFWLWHLLLSIPQCDQCPLIVSGGVRVETEGLCIVPPCGLNCIANVRSPNVQCPSM